MKTQIQLAVITLFVSMTCFAQPQRPSFPEPDNIFLSRDFWGSNPTPEIIDAKIKAGNDPAEANGANFDGVTLAINSNAPYESILHMISKPGNDVNKPTHDGRTYIFWAGYKGNAKLVEYLIKNGAKTDVRDDHDYTPLNFAANAGNTNLKVYDLLIANGANLKEDVNHDGANALLIAISKDKDFKLTEYFESKGLSIDSKDMHGNGAFNYVARTGNIDLMNTLIKKGVKGNNQAFLFASQGGRGTSNGLEVYNYLESVGLSPKVTNEDGQTPLHIIAARSKDTEILNYLLEKGLNANAEDNDGNTAFLSAASRNDLSILKALLKETKDINHANKKGETALLLAIRSNKPEVVEFLLDNGADLEVTDAAGNNATYALVSGLSPRSKDDFNKKLDLLKSKGLDIAAPQKSGNTLYHLAVEKNSTDLLNIAAKTKADVNAKNSDGNTALHIAAMKAKDQDILKFLLDKGAKKDAKTDFEETAYDLASENELLKKNNISIEFLK
ncbi:hypothetical protein PK35_16525 [Tamlana nanhaiensis]|uniref:Uncharacterized protein n=1 Tax=Neotamlana nanhaiensis TaxID=1382798 RepID=A0A0D7VW29_9FLAO|nr:ankyrin repeat domain-containing protein [Tamlana nanhaiensis]KJD31085.1 hypothetical protein PK35_16525 [Tamlana nanhaiensis]